MAWLQLRLQTRHPEFAEELLLAHGAQSVSFVDAGDTPVLEPLPGETPLWPQTAVLALFAEDADPEPALAAIAAILPEQNPPVVTREIVEDQDWVRLCLDQMQAMHFGGTLWICPRHRTVEDASAVVVRLDPGLAFGTGTHPSTSLCLRWLAQADIAGQRVLDYGCGSGILAIAALKLGAAAATGVDIDPQALTASLENARDNEVELTVCDVPGFKTAPYDLVLANILAGPLIELAPLLSACVRPGGQLVLAGLLDRQAEEVASAYAGDFEIEVVSDEGWTRLVGTRLP